MNTLSLRMPASTHQRLKDWAERDQVSINQFINSAVVEKLAALSTQAYLEARAQRASRAAFDAALAQVPDVPPTRAEDRWDKARS